MKIINQSSLISKIIFPDDTEQEITTLSNELETEFISKSFLKVKSSSKTYAIPEEEIEQTITLTNNSEFPITNVQILDILSTGATYKPNSVTINDVEKPSIDPSQAFTLENQIDANSVVTIKYKIIVDKDPTVSQITNKADITFSVDQRQDLKESTNEINLPVANNIITVIKSSDKSAVISGDTLTYKITIRNDGNLTNKSLVLQDILPSSVTFQENSVVIDSTPTPNVNPSSINLPELAPNSEMLVEFKVTVN